MRTLNDYFLTAKIADISTASSTYVGIPDSGRVIKIITALQGVIATANAAITFEIGGTAMTDSAITVAYSGSAVGDLHTSAPPPSPPFYPYLTIEIITDGASTNARVLYVTFVIRR